MKWKDLFLDVYSIGDKASVEPMLLSKLNMIKTTNSNYHSTKKYCDKLFVHLMEAIDGILNLFILDPNNVVFSNVS